MKFNEHIKLELELYGDSKGDQKVYNFLYNMAEDIKKEEKEKFGENVFYDEYYFESALKNIIVKYMSSHGEDWK